ncbi:hypothetical protein AB0877_07210 [Micromonospora sp. NPDC047644]|uniref:hypothetical protein n=1 Tax=Micromonospora sp. NPDC047644 TaxID=3157203 RepID=UPI0034565A12
MNLDDPDVVWRAKMIADVESGVVARATEALLSLTNHESDRAWIEGVLLEVVNGPFDLQVRQLAVICLGHVARIHRATSEAVIRELKVLEEIPEFRSRAKNALEDIEVFVK